MMVGRQNEEVNGGKCGGYGHRGEGTPLMSLGVVKNEIVSFSFMLFCPFENILFWNFEYV